MQQVTEHIPRGFVPCVVVSKENERGSYFAVVVCSLVVRYLTFDTHTPRRKQYHLLLARDLSVIIISLSAKNLGAGRILVNISAIWSTVGTWIKDRVLLVSISRSHHMHIAKYLLRAETSGLLAWF